ncbi:RNA pseudouridine synthase domain protein, partial [Treponema socranskii subsp. socranskii VPI DR56BR1116 = ATCC 35536]
LGQQFARRFVQKEYIAIVKGRPPALAGDIKTQIIRDPKNRKRFKAATQTEDGKSARTIYRCIASYGNYSLMRLRLKTGRTHQIRVHMKYIGCPILGDTVYGKKDDVFPEARLMLHAKKLTIRLPGKKKFSTFRSAVPDRFRTTLSFLKKNYPKEVPVWGKNHAKKKR